MAKAINLDEQLRIHRELAKKEDSDFLRNLEKYSRSNEYLGYAVEHPDIVGEFAEVFGTSYAAEVDTRMGVATPFGIPSIDAATGGVSAGVTEVYGDQSVGKTTFLAAVIGNAQKKGMEVAITSSEFFDSHYFSQLGVDLSSLLMMSAELDDLVGPWTDFVTGGEGRMLVIDSITALRPEGHNYDSYVHWKRAVGAFIEDITNDVSPTCCVLMSSQMRSRKSANPIKGFAGGSDSASAKIASQFSTRLELSRENLSEDTYDLVVNIVANTVRAPGLVLKLPVRKGEGVIIDVDILRVASELGIVNKVGSWFYGLNGELLGQGETSAAKNLGPYRDVILRKIYGVA